MPTPDPITEALLNVFESSSKRKQAELNLDKARAEENLRGRSAVPGVFAALQEQKEKAAAKAEKIRKQGEQGKQSFSLPTVDVTGMPNTRQSGAALEAAASIAQAVKGGPQPAQSMQGPPSGAIVGGAAQQLPPQAPAQQGGGANVNQLQPQTENLSPLQRALSFAEGLLAVRARSPALFYQGMEGALRGKKTIGYRDPLEIARETRLQTELEAKGLAQQLEKINEAERSGKSSQEVDILKARYLQRLIDLRDQVSPAVAQAAQRRAGMLMLEERAQKEKAQEAESRIRGRQSLGLQQREEAMGKRPDVQAKRRASEILMGIKDPEKFMREYRKMSPMNQLMDAIVGQAMEEITAGQGATPAARGPSTSEPRNPTDDEIQSMHDVLTSELGREPTVDEVKRRLIDNGFSFQ